MENILRLHGPEGREVLLPLAQTGPGTYQGIFQAGSLPPGVYTAVLRNRAGYQAELCLSIRRPWSWYIQMARKAALDAPQKASTHAESWYGFYSAYIARKYFPNKSLDEAVDLRFDEVFPLLYQKDTLRPLVQADRIQNHSSMVGVLVKRYEASQDSRDLKQAEILADLVLTFQGADGGFYKGGTDYTSVIYPAKSILELIHALHAHALLPKLPPAERARCLSSADRYLAAVTRAMDHLVQLDGNFQTEGATVSCYEDGANSCSAAQLSEFALWFPEDSPQRDRYTRAARRILDRHTSHEQALIPDSRMVGGTLRYWEAQYDVEMGGTEMAPRGQMMNSPHGWSAWNIYGLLHLYELTGEASYLRRGMNALGSCAQLMDFDGRLRWAFVPDPHRRVRIFEKNETAGGVAGRHTERVLGEEYVPMISSWWTAPPHTPVSGYTAMGGTVTQGAACDNDVHEVFKAMGEVALTKAYVLEAEPGRFECFNASVAFDGALLTVTPAEALVSQVSIQLLRARSVTVAFPGKTKTEAIRAGTPRWIRRNPED